MESTRVDQLRELFGEWSNYEQSYSKNLANLVLDYQKVIDTQQGSDEGKTLPLNYLKFVISVLDITSSSHETFANQISQASRMLESDYRSSIVQKSKRLLEGVDTM